MAIQFPLRRIRKSRSIRDPGSSPNTVRNPGGQAENSDGPWQGVFGAPLTWVFPNHLVYLAVPPMTQETSHERAFVRGAGLEARGSHQPSGLGTLCYLINPGPGSTRDTRCSRAQLATVFIDVSKTRIGGGGGGGIPGTHLEIPQLILRWMPNCAFLGSFASPAV